MINKLRKVLCLTAICMIVCSVVASAAENSGGIIFNKVNLLKQQNAFNREYNLFNLLPARQNSEVSAVVKQYTTLSPGAEMNDVITNKPPYIKVILPIENGARSLTVLLYKVNISPEGFTLITSDGQPFMDDNRIVSYRGSIDNDSRSVAAITFSDNETMGIISNDEGNYVLGKIQDKSGAYIIYNDQHLIPKTPFNCSTKEDLVNGSFGPSKRTSSTTATKCVNMYWETDYDLFTSKGSTANVNSYIQGAFNQTATMFANDGITVNLKTLFVWTTVDPYTGPVTDNFLDQFGAYRTSFAGDIATLVGYQGNGGIAYVGTLCFSTTAYKMAYCGISSSYSVVPTYSWTVECLTHENGHVLGSNHTHSCCWNGNNTKIDDCGGSAGYSAGTCLPQPNPVLPVGGGTIMSYCDLTSVGIKFNLGFGPQPAALIVSRVNNATCLSTCGGCTTPAQPAFITGTTTTCPNAVDNYTAATVTGATSYTWSLPAGWTGNSTTNAITAVAGSTSGFVVITANNSCGSSSPQSIAVTVTTPTQPGAISGSTSACSGSSQTYSVAAVSGASSFTWTLPSGWSGSSTTNSITVTAGSLPGTITVKANNSCGSSAAQSLAVSIGNAVAQPGIITGTAVPCKSTTQVYSVVAVTGATSYTWTLPSGWTGTSTTNSITATVGTSGGTISVTANSNCASSAAQSLAVSVASLVQPGHISGSTFLCSSSSQVYSVLPVVGATSYTWILPSGWSGSSTTNSITVTSGTAGGTISVKATFQHSGIRSLEFT